MQMLQVTSMPILANPVSLHGIANGLINDVAPIALSNHNFVINNVSPDLLLEANGTMVASVLSKLFHTVLRHAENSIILVTAKVYGMTVLVKVESKGTISPGLPEDMGNACIKAQKTGGIIEMTQYENNQASIGYCFLNVAGEA